MQFDSTSPIPVLIRKIVQKLICFLLPLKLEDLCTELRVNIQHLLTPSFADLKVYRDLQT